MDKNKQKRFKRTVRHNRVRAQISGSAQKPRLSVFRSLGHIYAQLIDDLEGKTLVQASSQKQKISGKKVDVAFEVGKKLAQAAKVKNISEVVFDRGGYKYHGRVKRLAEGAREGGLVF